MGSMKVFLKVEGMPGSSSEAARAEEWSDVLFFSHAVEYPFDMTQNRGTGEPQHGMLMVTKAIDKATPHLARALVRKERVEGAELEFERDNPTDGSTQMYYKIKLTDCRVVSYSTSMSTEEGTPPHQETVGFAYRTIVWTFDDGSGAVETQFDFSDPQA